MALRVEPGTLVYVPQQLRHILMFAHVLMGSRGQYCKPAIMNGERKMGAAQGSLLGCSSLVKLCHLLVLFLLFNVGQGMEREGPDTPPVGMPLVQPRWKTSNPFSPGMFVCKGAHVYLCTWGPEDSPGHGSSGAIHLVF